MADDTYRRFHSGRFGTEGIQIPFDTQIAGASGVTVNKKDPKKKDEEEPNQDQKDYADSVSAGKAIPGMEGE